MTNYGWIQERRLAIIDLLLESSEVDVNAHDIYGISPLHIAAHDEYLSESVFQKLIDKGANISLSTADKETSLHFAIADRNDVVISKLVPLGADPAFKDVTGHNALLYAARKIQLSILQDILTWTPKHSLQTVLESKDNYGQNILHHLLGSRGHVNVELTAYLVEQASGINDLDKGGLTPVAVFLSKFAPCAHEADTKVLDYLFEHGADPTSTTVEGLGLVSLAARFLRLSVGLFQSLAKGGSSLTCQDSQGRTALHHSAESGTLTKKVLRYRQEVAKLPLNLHDGNGKTALDYAIEKEQEVHGPNLFKPDRWLKTETLLRGIEEET
ncbi:hypothetical protein NW768_011232 [Fusarium equiseti]|uniref:Ankyrin n=1 Tax=Fusarium equiseti TaxID=61235 RepID=A0ABQ8QYH5_FUSEQ|nr:hypothetical protein NW768_011232 [Fusarium equiseti]